MNRNKHKWLQFFCFFINFHCSQLFYCSFCPTAAPASLNMHVVSANLAKTLICKNEYDVILWRHNTTHTSKKTTMRKGVRKGGFWD